jgi:hypothetical protein
VLGDDDGDDGDDGDVPAGGCGAAVGDDASQIHHSGVARSCTGADHV